MSRPRTKSGRVVLSDIVQPSTRKGGTCPTRAWRLTLPSAKQLMPAVRCELKMRNFTALLLVALAVGCTHLPNKSTQIRGVKFYPPTTYDGVRVVARINGIPVKENGTLVLPSSSREKLEVQFSFYNGSTEDVFLFCRRFSENFDADGALAGGVMSVPIGNTYSGPYHLLRGSRFTRKSPPSFRDDSINSISFSREFEDHWSIMEVEYTLEFYYHFADDPTTWMTTHVFKATIRIDDTEQGVGD